MTVEKEYEPGLLLWENPAFRRQLEEEKPLGESETKSLEKQEEAKSTELWWRKRNSIFQEERDGWLNKKSKGAQRCSNKELTDDLVEKVSGEKG